MITLLVWLVGLLIVLGLWLYRRRTREGGLGTVSQQWLVNHRRDTHVDN